MTQPTRPTQQAPAPDAERGSALIISLMITVILTMLGVTYLVLSEQEEKISINSRDHAQTLYLAEAAVELAKTWFNDPTSANLFKPTDAQLNLTLRRGRVFEEGYTNELEREEMEDDPTATDGVVNGAVASARYTGGNLGVPASAKFEKPYRGPYNFGFWGRQDQPDVLICSDASLDIDGIDDGSADCTANGIAYLTDVTNGLRMGTVLQADGHSTRDYGLLEIEQIRVYRPPIDFDLHTRYGIATIEATAVKRVRGQVVARRTVREVIHEVPYPGPGGAIETEGSIDMGGSLGIHWGQIVSTDASGNIILPNGANKPDPSVPRSSSSRWGYHFTLNPASGADQDSSGNFATALTELVGATKNGAAGGGVGTRIPDPWLVLRARNVIEGTANSSPHPHPYGPANFPTLQRISGNGVNAIFVDDNQKNWSHFFQREIVRFPSIDYKTWKEVSQSGQAGMHYFQHVAGQTFQEDGVGPTQSVATWLEQYDRGIFFFDTTDESEPLPDNSNLTATAGWTASLFVEGFVYLNSGIDPSGGNPPTMNMNMPGEPFLDDGIDLKNPAQNVGDNCICVRFDSEENECVLGIRPIGAPAANGAAPCSNQTNGIQCACSSTQLLAMDPGVAAAEAATFRNGVWDSDINNDGASDSQSDMAAMGAAWTRWIADNNATTDAMALSSGHGFPAGKLPYYPASRTNQGQDANDWKRDVRFLNNLADFGANAGDRQPHEPFLNLRNVMTDSTTVGSWPANSAGGNIASYVDWRGAGAVVKQDANGNATQLTTRSRDATGPLVSQKINLNGVLYAHGAFAGSGNMNVYGSILVRGGYTGGGSIEVWFNEGLVKGDFPDPKWKLPRIYATARDTN